MDSLRDKTSPNAVKKALRILPNTLDLAYEDAMQRIDDQLQGFKDSAKRLLGWLTHSERLMTVREVQHALAIIPGASEFDEDDLGDIDEIICCCAGLVDIDEETQILRLVHYTTQEYFRQNHDKLPCAQQDIAVGCLTYLLYENFKDGWDSETGWDSQVEQTQKEEREGSEEHDIAEPEREQKKNNEDEHERERDRGNEGERKDQDKATRYLYRELFEEESEDDERKIPTQASVQARVERYPFLEYAARYWAAHVTGSEDPIVRELMMDFVKDDRKVSSASQVVLVLDKSVFLIYAINETKSRGPFSAIHALAYLGYDDLMSELLDHGFELTHYSCPDLSEFRELR